MKWNDIKDVIKKELKESKLLEATLTADNTKFNIRTGVNKNPTKVGIKIQLEPSSGYLDPSVKDQLEVAIQEKLNTELADYDIQVSKDTDVPRDHVIGFFIPLSQLKNLIVTALGGKKEEAGVQAPEPETNTAVPAPQPPPPTPPLNEEKLMEKIISEKIICEALKVRTLNEISKTVLKEDFYGFVNTGNNIVRTLEESGFDPQISKKYLEHLVKFNIV